ncbi:MAG: imm11 family protein [Thermonemataceae bacterium]|mgnify:CR=1 FL=1
MPKFVRLKTYQPKDSLWIKEVTGINKIAEQNSYKSEFIDNIGSPNITFSNKSAKLTDYVGGVGTSFRIVSHRLKKVLDLLSDKRYIQFFECDSNYTKKAKFYIMHILGYLDCFDWENSKYIKRTTAANKNEFWADKITELMMLEDVIGNRNIFRMSQSMANIFISKKLENIILEKQLRVTLVRTQDLTQLTDVDPNNPSLAIWGHENIR